MTKNQKTLVKIIRSEGEKIKADSLNDPSVNLGELNEYEFYKLNRNTLIDKDINLFDRHITDFVSQSDDALNYTPCENSTFFFSVFKDKLASMGRIVYDVNNEILVSYRLDPNAFSQYNIAELSTAYVDPVHRGKGLGKISAKFRTNEALETNVDFILTCAREGASAHILESQGYSLLWNSKTNPIYQNLRWLISAGQKKIENYSLSNMVLINPANTNIAVEDIKSHKLSSAKFYGHMLKYKLLDLLH